MLRFGLLQRGRGLQRQWCHLPAEPDGRLFIRIPDLRFGRPIPRPVHHQLGHHCCRHHVSLRTRERLNNRKTTKNKQKIKMKIIMIIIIIKRLDNNNSHERKHTTRDAFDSLVCSILLLCQSLYISHDAEQHAPSPIPSIKRK